MLRHFKHAAHLLQIAAGEFLAGIVADGVERILSERRAAHKHMPMVVQPHVPGYATWALSIMSVKTGRKDACGFDIWEVLYGLRVCGICKKVYYEEVQKKQ